MTSLRTAALIAVLGTVAWAQITPEMRIVAACHRLPCTSWKVLPCPAPVMKPPGFAEKGLKVEYSNGPRGRSLVA